MRNVTWIAVAVLGLSACGSQQPILYPNAQLQAAGPPAAEQAIAECEQLAANAGASEGGSQAADVATRTATGAAVGAATGAVGGAIAGAAGRGSLIGAATGATAGLISSIFSRSGPSPAYVNFVNRCLNERGFEVAGWE